MFRLLTIEFHKLKHNRASKILSIVYFTLLTSIALIATVKFDIGPIKFHLAKQGIFNFPYIWHFNTFVAAIFKFILLLVIVSMVTNEYNYKTLKQNLIDGLSKKEFILSKFYMIVAFSLVSTVFVCFISLILGLIYSDFNELSIIFSDLNYLLAFFVKLLGFFSFGLFLGILIKRSAFSVGFIIIWYFIEWLLYIFLGGKIVSNWNTAQNIKNFFPLEAMQNLIIEPGTRLGAVKSIVNQVGKEISKDYSVNFTTIAIVLIWATIFMFLSYFLLKYRDL